MAADASADGAMKLHRLELENFKSYKGKQIVGPFTNFTAIIGPNGSGKSNVMDAISFVLGVNTRDLRAKQLKNLVYGSGSSLHTGDLDASVTAVLQNEATGMETRFRREITGKGGTEYRINGKVVQWKQYNERLEKHNIIVKARNFLVFQGDVEAIAQKTPMELTAMFESVSGSADLKSTYDELKQQKQKAEEALKMAQANKKSFTSEKRLYHSQKEEAEKFETLGAERAAIEAQHIVWRLFYTERDITTFEGKAETLQADVDEAAKLQERAEKLLAEKNSELAKAKKKVSKVTTSIKSEEVKMQKLEPQRISANEKIKHQKKLVTKAEKKKADIEGQASRAEQEVADLEQQLSEIKKTAEKYDKKHSQESSGVVLNEAQFKEYHALKEKANSRTARTGAALAKKKRELDVATTTRETLESEVKELSDDVKTKEGSREGLETRQKKLEERLNNLKDTKKEAQAKAANLEKEVKSAETEITKLQDTAEQLSVQLKEAKADRHESSRARKLDDAVQVMKDRIPGVHGKLINLCRPSQAKYNTAVAVIMGKHMDSVVVENADVGNECIKYLRENRIPPATFIPLNSIKSSKDSEQLRNVSSGTAWLMRDVIEFEAKFKPAVDFAVGNAVVCTTEKECKRLCYVTKQAKKAVTLNGTVIRQSGPIEGGLSGVENKAKRWAEADVSKLKAERDQTQKRINELSRTKRKKQELETLTSQIQGHETQITFINADLKDAKAKWKRLTGNTAALEKSIAQKESQRDAAAAKADKLATEVAELAESLETEVDTVFKTFCKKIGVKNVREYEGASLAEQQKVMQKKAQYADVIAKLEASIVHQKSQNFDAEIEKLESTVEKCNEAIVALEEELNVIKESISVHKDKIEELAESKKELDDDVETHAVSVKEIKKRASEYAENKTKAKRDIAKTENHIEALKGKRHDYLKKCKVEEIEIPLTSGSLDSIVDGEAAGMDDESERPESSVAVDSLDTQNAAAIYAREAEIAVDFSGLDEDLCSLESSDDIADVDKQFRDKLASMQTQLESMRPNLSAAKKLASLADALTESKAKFEEVQAESKRIAAEFAKVQQERADLFSLAFEHVKSVIDPIYKQLTTAKKRAKGGSQGGAAFIGMENSEEPFAGGVKYNVMPPHKRYREMDQLSGGEKTVAALALLFAVHSYQEAPFFVLDEVDAALDNTNIHRVARFISAKTKSNFQCIVISLKDQFYENADSLVGIYRDKSEDCSHCITVDLAKYGDISV